MKFVIISLLFVLGGCASTFDSESRVADEYTLKTSVVRTATVSAAVSSVSIALMRIETAPGYDTRHILVTRPDGRLDVLADARWAGSIASLLEVATIDHLRAAGMDAHINSAAFTAPYALRVTVRRFDAEYVGDDDSSRVDPPTVRVALDATLIRRRDRSPVATWSISGAAVATENRRAMIVSAFGSAASTALEGLAAELSAVTALKQ